MEILQQSSTSWLVSSESDPAAVHVVTFYRSETGRFMAHCSCTDFSCRHEPRIKHGGSVRANCCKHIRAVVEWLAWAAAERLTELYPEGIEP